MNRTPETSQQNTASAPQNQDREPAGHVSPQIDETKVEPDKQIAELGEQASGQGSGQS